MAGTNSGDDKQSNKRRSNHLSHIKGAAHFPSSQALSITVSNDRQS